MYRNSLSIIDPEDARKARDNNTKEIRQERRRAAAMRAIASQLDNAYVTKALVPKLQAAIPDAKRVYISQSRYSKSLELTVSYAVIGCDDSISFIIASTDNRRINAADLMKSADSATRQADMLESALQHLEELVSSYNAIADQYAAIYDDLTTLFGYGEMPSADYALGRKYAGITPEQFVKDYAS